jgi:hypothetical protein
MCQFKSAIVLKDESLKGGFRLLLSPWTESHSDLIILHKLRDNGRLSFARVEFSPPSMDQAHMVETYMLRLDEERTPDWFSEKMRESVTVRMADYIKSCIVSGPAELLMGGQFIVAHGATVERADGMVISAICGGTVNDICGGTVNDIWGNYAPTIKHITKEATIVRDNRKAK